MELYALLLLHGAEPEIETHAGSPTSSLPVRAEAKQLAHCGCGARQLAVRRGAFSRTELTDAGPRARPRGARRRGGRRGGADGGDGPDLRVLGGATLADTTLPSMA
jgi:hypothetical protein